MRISDWSSDVCSSDLSLFPTRGGRCRRAVGERDDEPVPVERHRPLSSCRRGRAGEPRRRLVLSRSQGGGGGDRGSHRLLERRRGRLTARRSEEHTSELQSLMRISYAVFCLKKQNIIKII